MVICLAENIIEAFYRLQPFINILFTCGDAWVTLMTPAPKQHTELHKITKTSSC